MKIIEESEKVGGGTDEKEALEGVYGELRLSKSNVIKIVMVFTDGVGNKEGVVPIMQQVEADNEVLFAAIGLGETEEAANDVVKTYVEPLRHRDKNVFGIAKVNPQDVIPEVLDFLRREVNKRRQSY